MNTLAKKSFVGILLIAFIGVLSFGSMGLTHEAYVAHQGCPFAADEQGMCPMMSFKDVEFIPGIIVLLFGLIVAISLFCKQRIVLVLEKQKSRFDQLRRKKKIALYQDLFSQGILNPKAP